MITECLMVGLGGFIGSILRYLIGFIDFGDCNGFPVNTFIINILGVLLISFIAFYMTTYSKSHFDESTLKFIVLFLKVGVCGGFTTFSTFALETGDLIKSGNIEIALLYALLSVVIGVCIIFLPDLLFKSL